MNPASSFKLGFQKAAPEEVENLTSITNKANEANELLRRGAQLGDLQKIRDAQAMGADLNATDDGSEAMEGKAEGKVGLTDVKPEIKNDSDTKDGDKDENEDKAEKQAERLKKSKEILKGSDLKTGDTALHYACEKNHVEAVDLLLRLGASIDSKNRIGSTPLHRAVSCKHELVVEKLLKFSADLKVANKIGNTALHIAMYVGYVPIIKLILQVGTLDLLKLKNKVGLIPSEYAKSAILLELAKEFPKIAEILHQKNSHKLETLTE